MKNDFDRARQLMEEGGSDPQGREEGGSDPQGRGEGRERRKRRGPVWHVRVGQSVTLAFVSEGNWNRSKIGLDTKL